MRVDLGDGPYWELHDVLSWGAKRAGEMAIARAIRDAAGGTSIDLLDKAAREALITTNFGSIDWQAGDLARLVASTSGLSVKDVKGVVITSISPDALDRLPGAVVERMIVEVKELYKPVFSEEQIKN